MSHAPEMIEMKSAMIATSQVASLSNQPAIQSTVVTSSENNNADHSLFERKGSSTIDALLKVIDDVDHDDEAIRVENTTRAYELIAAGIHIESKEDFRQIDEKLDSAVMKQNALVKQPFMFPLDQVAISPLNKAKIQHIHNKIKLLLQMGADPGYRKNGKATVFEKVQVVSSKLIVLQAAFTGNTKCIQYFIERYFPTIKWFPGIKKSCYGKQMLLYWTAAVYCPQSSTAQFRHALSEMPVSGDLEWIKFFLGMNIDNFRQEIIDLDEKTEVRSQPQRLMDLLTVAIKMQLPHLTLSPDDRDKIKKARYKMVKSMVSFLQKVISDDRMGLFVASDEAYQWVAKIPINYAVEREWVCRFFDQKDPLIEKNIDNIIFDYIGQKAGPFIAPNVSN